MSSRKLSQPEFVAMMALIMSVAALSTDMMLPAFPEIAQELTPQAPERTALIVSIFMLGLGVGTFFTGPLSDAFGRKPVITAGLALYGLGAILSWFAPSFGLLLAGRVLQGLGAACPRVVAPAMIRDLYEGRKMAQMTSFIMAVFMFVPAAAPWAGELVMAVLDWRSIFGTFVLVGMLAALWLNVRQAETLPVRRPLHPEALRTGLADVFAFRAILLYTVVLALGFSQLITLISTVQPIYAQTFNVPHLFAPLFMAGALISSAGTLLNATLVMQLGMRLLVKAAFAVQVVFALLYLGLLWLAPPQGLLAVAVFFAWSTQALFMAGMTFGNLNALALQPLGHVAGLANSVITGFSTVGAAVIAAFVGLAAAGAPWILALHALICSGLSLLMLLRWAPRH